MDRYRRDPPIGSSGHCTTIKPETRGNGHSSQESWIARRLVSRNLRADHNKDTHAR